MADLLYMFEHTNVMMSKLLTSFLDNDVPATKLFQGKNSVIRSFRAKVYICWTLGLFEESDAEDLLKFGELRNMFAHGEVKNWHDEKIVSLHASLSINKVMSNSEVGEIDEMGRYADFNLAVVSALFKATDRLNSRAVKCK